MQNTEYRIQNGIRFSRHTIADFHTPQPPPTLCCLSRPSASRLGSGGGGAARHATRRARLSARLGARLH